MALKGLIRRNPSVTVARWFREGSPSSEGRSRRRWGIGRQTVAELSVNGEKVVTICEIKNNIFLAYIFVKKYLSLVLQITFEKIVSLQKIGGCRKKSDMPSPHLKAFPAAFTA